MTYGCRVQNPRGQGAGLSLKADGLLQNQKERWPRLEVSEAGRFLATHRRLSLFVLGRPSTGWVRPTHNGGVGRGRGIFPETTSFNAESHPESTLVETPRTAFDQLSGTPHGSAKLTFSIVLGYHEAWGKQTLSTSLQKKKLE